MKVMKYFAVTSLALLAACSNEEELTKKSQEQQVLSIKFSEPSITRAVENSQGVGTAEFTAMTLYFWGNANKTISKGKQVLTSEQIQKAKTSDGALVGMPEGATHVSMTANNILGGNMQDSPVTGFQSLGDGFLSKVPMSSPAAVPTPHSTIANAKQVNLVPVPDLARIEVSGSITPQENAKAPVGADGKKCAYKSVKVKAVYVNNYYPTAKASDVSFTASDGDWQNYEVSMHDVLTDENRSNLADKSKAAAYQVFPAKETDKLPHIIVEVSYVLNDVNSTEVSGRYLTIRKYKENTSFLTSFIEGKIYKLDLAALNSAFGTDDGGNPIDPTDPVPEAVKTDLYVLITAYTWSVSDITPEL